MRRKRQKGGTVKAKFGCMGCETWKVETSYDGEVNNSLAARGAHLSIDGHFHFGLSSISYRYNLVLGRCLTRQGSSFNGIVR